MGSNSACVMPGDHAGTPKRWVMLEYGDTSHAYQIVVCDGHWDASTLQEAFQYSTPVGNPAVTTAQVTKLKTTKRTAAYKIPPAGS